MRLIKEVTPEAFRLLSDATRKKIIFLLRVKQLTVNQISAELGLTTQAIYHQIKKLETAGLIEVSKEERVDHMIERYYQTTAETFVCHYGSLPEEKAKMDMLAVLKGLNRIGFSIESNDEIATKLADFEAKLMKHKDSKKLEDAITKLEKDMDFLTLMIVKDYAHVILMSDEEYEERRKLRKKFRQFLISICREKPEFSDA